MVRCIALLTFLVVAAPVGAEPLHITGEKDGVRFDYTSEMRPDGQLIIQGTYLNTGEKFGLTVSRHGHVDGWVGPAWVDYDVSPEVRDQAAEALGSSNNVQLAQSSKAR